MIPNRAVFLLKNFRREIPYFRNKKQSGASRISQSLVGPLQGTRCQAGRHFVPSNGPISNCEMRLAPDCFSFLKEWM